MSARMPKIPALKLFVEVMETGTIALAAERLHLTHSAASRMLSAFEKDLNLKLFKRERQRLFPTEAATSFLPEALRALSVLDELPKISDAIREGATKDQLIRILSFPRMGEEIIPAAIRRYFAETGADTRININVEARHNLKRWAASRMFDIALTSVPVAHPGVRAEPLVDFPLCVILPRDHPMATERDIPVEVLADAPLSSIEKGSILRQRLARVFDEAGLTPNIRHESSTMDVAIHVGLAAGSLAVTDGIFPKSVLDHGFVLRRLKTEHSVPVGFVVPLDQEVEGATAIMKEAIRQEVFNYRTGLNRVLDAD